jgi:hypothetical protein
MKNPKEIKRLVDTLFTGQGVYPERFIANIDKDNFNLPVLRMVSRLADNYPSNPRIIEEFPDIYKANTERLLGIEPRFDIPNFNKNLTMREAIDRLNSDDMLKDNKYIDAYSYLKNLIDNKNFAEKSGIVSLIKSLSSRDLDRIAPVIGGPDMIRKSMYDLFKEIATLRNPQGVTVYRDPNYMRLNPVVKRSGILSFTKDPRKLAFSVSDDSDINFDNVSSYNLKPRSIVADFSKTPFGYPFEHEVQAIISKTRKPNEYLGNYFQREAEL